MILIPLCVCLVPLLTSVPQHTQDDASAHLQSLTLPMDADRDGLLSAHDIAVSLPSLTLVDQQSLKVFSSHVLTATFASLLSDDDDKKDGDRDMKDDGDDDKKNHVKDDDKKKHDKDAKQEKQKSEKDKAPKVKADDDEKKPQAHSSDAAHPRGRFEHGDHRPGKGHRPPGHALRSGQGGRSALAGKGPYRRPEHAGRSWHAGGRHEATGRSGFMHGSRQMPGRGWGMGRGPMGMPHMAKPQSPKSPFAQHPQFGNAGAPFGPHFSPLHGSHLGSSSGPQAHVSAGGAGPHADPMSAILFELLDLNHDGNLSRDEFQRLSAATAKAHSSQPRMHAPSPKADHEPGPHHGATGFEAPQSFKPGPPMHHGAGGNMGPDRNKMNGPPRNFPNGHRSSPPGDMRTYRRPEPGKTPDHKPDHEPETRRRPDAEREPERSEKPESDAQPTQLLIDESEVDVVAVD